VQLNPEKIKKPIRIAEFLKPHLNKLIIAFIAAIAEAAANLLEPLPLKLVFDFVLRDHPVKGWLQNLIVSIFGEHKLSILGFAASAVLVIALLGAIASYAYKYYTTTVGQWVTHELRRTLYSHIQKLSLAYHDKKKTGDLISRATVDIDAIQSFITTGLLGSLIDCLTIAGMITVMLHLDWKFTLIALSVLPLLFLVIYSFTRRIKSAAREVRKKEGEMASIITEVLSSIRVVKAFAREEYELRRLEEQSLENVEIALRARSMKAKLMPLVEVIVAAGTCLVLWFGVRLVLSGNLSAGDLIVFISYLSKLYKPIQDLSKISDTYSKASVGYERICEILNTHSNVGESPLARRAPRFKGRIDFEHVNFSYAAEQLVLRDINLTIEPGQVVALVGPTGAGKTTIISLIPRFYDPDSGLIKIDGYDIRYFLQKSVRQQISFVLQETLLFNAPVWENIAYGKPEAGYAEIIRAAQMANAHEFVEKLPEGYNTTVGERGVTLSGGQRQRIAIARAIIRDAPILILDEPSSGLDAASEKLVFEALDRLMEGKTSIVIAHRLSTIMRADIIFVIDNGSIVEKGRHEELLSLNGLYAGLFKLQVLAPEDHTESHDSTSWITG
jgi:ATP-binding cassette, subfamily B, bacterial